MTVDDVARPWRWRNCREIEFGAWLCLLPWQWHIGYEWEADHTFAHGRLHLGPLSLQIHANIGNCSDEGWRGRFGLSESQAWNRSAR